MLLFCEERKDGLVYARMMKIVSLIHLSTVSAYRGSRRWTPAKRPGRKMIVSE